MSSNTDTMGQPWPYYAAANSGCPNPSQPTLSPAVKVNHMARQYGKGKDKLELLLWSIALPGFGQLLSHQYVKGILLIVLEFMINVYGNFNDIIILSFHGDIQEAVDQANYGWLMFYPCLYFFAMWDVYKEAAGGIKPYAFLPFVFSAYFVTVGLIFSPNVTLFGQLIGPVWLPMLGGVPVGLITGGTIQWLLSKKLAGKTDAEEP